MCLPRNGGGERPGGLTRDDEVSVREMLGKGLIKPLTICEQLVLQVQPSTHLRSVLLAAREPVGLGIKLEFQFHHFQGPFVSLGFGFSPVQ